MVTLWLVSVIIFLSLCPSGHLITKESILSFPPKPKKTLCEDEDWNPLVVIFSLTSLLPLTYSSILAPFVTGYLEFPASFKEIKFDFSVRFSRMVASEFKLFKIISRSPSRSKSAYAAPLLYEGRPVLDAFTFSKFNFPLFLNKMFGILKHQDVEN